MMKMMKSGNKIIFNCICILAMAFSFHATAQSNTEIFGQNRIQKRKFDWKFFDTKHFRVYHYDKAGRQLGRYVAEEAENSIKVIERKMEGQFPDRFNIVLYNSYDEYRQSNIGLKDESEISQVTISGTWNLVGDKLVVYHTGKHADLKHQIQTGMAQAVMEYIIYGEKFKKVASTTFLKELPPWVLKGFISYAVDGWTTESNSEWKRIMDANPKMGFHLLSQTYPELAGKAFWKFVNEVYGAEKMKSLMVELQKKTKINNTIKSKEYLGDKIIKVYDSCMTFYKNSYAIDSPHQELPDSTKGLISLKVPKDNTIIRNVMVSPRGSDIAFTAWKNGMYTIYTQKTSKEQVQSVLLEGGEKDPSAPVDPNYPLMTWSHAGNKLAILYKVKNKTCLRIYNSQKNRIENFVIPPNRFDRVLGMTFMEDDNFMVFSAIKKSQTDLFKFTIKGSKMTNITDDAWDDIDPVFVSGGSRKGILFLSNRPKPNMEVPQGVNELPNGTMNVFFYNTTTQRKELLQCSNITTGHISQPIQYGSDNFAYLYDGNGIFNRYAVIFGRDHKNMDSAYAVPITNYNTSIISHQYNLAVNEVADVIQIKKKYMVYYHGPQLPNDSTPAKTLVPTVLSAERPDSLTENHKAGRHRSRLPFGLGRRSSAAIQGATEIKTGNTFQTEFTDTSSIQLASNKPNENPNTRVAKADDPNEADSSMLKIINDSAYIKMKPAAYRRSFKPDMLNMKLDNSILFTRYESYANTGGQYQNPALGPLTTLNLTELMEDYKVTVGFQIPLDFSSSSYFVQYKNMKRKVDWSVLLFRTQNKSYYDILYPGLSEPKTELVKNYTTMVQAEFNYPFSKIRSLRFQTALRQDKLVQKSMDTFSLSYEIPNTVQYWSLSRMEYVFDNTTSPLLDIRLGTRYKAYIEYMDQVNGNNQNCYNFGFDYRTYTKVYRNAIVAVRAAYSHSDGPSQVQYQLGGVDNWYQPQSANTPPTDGNYGFIMLATSMRGYLQGSLKGNNYAVGTIEGRAPLSSFINRPIKSSVLRDLIGVVFCDAGSAWRGFTPTADNLSSTYTYYQFNNTNAMQLKVTVPNSSGLELGYGAGLRTTVVGYFVRFDMAWNPELCKPVKYFALGMDF